MTPRRTFESVIAALNSGEIYQEAEWDALAALLERGLRLQTLAAEMYEPLLYLSTFVEEILPSNGPQSTRHYLRKAEEALKKARQEGIHGA